MKKFLALSQEFKIPLAVIFGTILWGVFILLKLQTIATVIIFTAVFLGSFDMLKESIISLSKKQFALDYIAILAIVVGLITHQFLVAAILSLMLSTGGTLEDYGVKQAKRSLTHLVDRIPTDVTTFENGVPGKKEKIGNIKINDLIFIRKGEVIGLDGVLVSEIGETDESSLTGEPYFINKIKGDLIRSGTINIGQPIVIKVSRPEKESTYKKIVDMVQTAQSEKSPMVRLADRYSTFFTVITLSIAAFSYFYGHFDLTRVLSVLAVATPCPLIIATPIALLGGMNASAKQKIIIKRLSALETLSRTNVIAFDKTGTITLGKPQLINIEILDKKYSEQTALSIAEAIERNSLHPLAKAIVNHAVMENVPVLHADGISEKIGQGISGVVEKKEYTLSKLKQSSGMAIELKEGKDQIAIFSFEDRIKQESKETIRQLIESGLILELFTGDKKDAAEKIVTQLGIEMNIHAECSPEDKQTGIQKLKNEKRVVTMVGDGINDAPALALADVGMAFSSEEQTAASEAADIVFLGGDFSSVLSAWRIATRTISIAEQSILWGIGLSILAMIFATFGFIPPIFGAGLQEAIDIAVILNALRASR